MIKLSTLKPNPKNPRKISKENLQKLCKSIKDFERMLELRPIIIDENNIVLGGNQRLTALLKLGYKEIPENWVKKTKSLTKEEKRRFIISDNIEYGEWDEDILKSDDWNDFELKDFNLDIDLEMNWGDDEDEVEEDECPALKKESIVKMGDIWLLGKHRLKCGDSTIVSSIDDLMNKEKADVVFSDPPYGMFLDADYSSMKKIGKGNKYKNVKGDHNDFSYELINTVFSNFDYCKEIFLWGADYYSEVIPDRNKGSWIVWDKMQNGEGVNDDYDKMFGSNFELCWSKTRHKRALARVLWKGIFGLNDKTEDSKKRVHPTQKPIKLCNWFLEKFSKKENIIVDLFGGSGSTLIACEQLNRRCYMMELDELYCQVIIDRYINFKQNKGKNIFLLKDGKKIPYKEIVKSSK